MKRISIRAILAALALILYISYQSIPDTLTPEEKAYLLAYEKTTNKRPSIPFTTDHCSIVPDLDLRHMCFVHDVVYYYGGTRIERYWADTKFYDEVYEKHGHFIAELYFFSVRLGGENFLSTSLWPWRWGYGYGVGDTRANE